MIARKRLLTSIAALVLACRVTSPGLAASVSYDLTGTWAGTIKCQSSVAGTTTKVTLTPTMQLTQVGRGVGMQFTVGNDVRSYVGLTDPDAKKAEQKGELAAALCGTDNVLGQGRDEIARMAVSAKAGKVKATIKGLTVFSNPGEAGFCSWKWTRTDTANANVPTACPSSFASIERGAALTDQDRSDLTGTWVGKFNCNGSQKGGKIKFGFQPTIRITQSALTVGMAVDYGAGDVDLYGGLMIPDGKKPRSQAKVSVDYCGTNGVVGESFDELGVVTTTTKPPGVKASLKGTTLYSDEGVADPEAGTCKWSFKRTSTTDPNVPTTCAAGASAARR